MAGLGVGLGAFVDGFKQGYGIRADMQDRERRRAIEDEQLQWDREDRAYLSKEREREQGKRDRIDAVNADAREEFEAGVEAGKYSEKDFDAFWTDYALPKMKHELLLAGDTAGASALDDWGQSEGAKRGGRLFAGALIKAQTGDVAGALDDALEAARVQGYMSTGFEISGKEEIKDADGTVVGYRVTLKDEDGNEMVQDLANEDVADAIANFANPAAAWASQKQAQAAQGKRAAELADYETKKQIDAKYDTDGKGSKARSEAIKSIRERDKDSLDDTPKFDDLTPDEQERQIQKELDLQSGARSSAVPSAQIVVDGTMGTQVTGQAAVPTPTSQAPGIKKGPSGAQVANAAPALGISADRGRMNGYRDIQEMGPSDPPQSPAQKVKVAADMMVAGQDPNQIAEMLRSGGVAPEYWPEGLTNAVNPGGTARSSPAPM